MKELSRSLEVWKKFKTSRDVQMPRCRITISEVTHELLIRLLISKTSIKKIVKTFSGFLNAGKLQTEQNLITHRPSGLHSSPYLFWTATTANLYLHDYKLLQYFKRIGNKENKEKNTLFLVKIKCHYSEVIVSYHVN